MTPSLIPLLSALHTVDDKVQRDAGSLLLLSADEVEERAAECHGLFIQCGHSISSCQPLSHSETETLHQALAHLRHTIKFYRYVLRAARRSCCATLAPIDRGSTQPGWQGY